VAAPPPAAKCVSVTAGTALNQGRPHAQRA
jgi:hypothetical protein